jgi:hypothetical protein
VRNGKQRGITQHTMVMIGYDLRCGYSSNTLHLLRAKKKGRSSTA